MWNVSLPYSGGRVHLSHLCAWGAHRAAPEQYVAADRTKIQQNMHLNIKHKIRTKRADWNMYSVHMLGDHRVTRPARRAHARVYTRIYARTACVRSFGVARMHAYTQTQCTCVFKRARQPPCLRIRTFIRACIILQHIQPRSVHKCKPAYVCLTRVALRSQNYIGSYSNPSRVTTDHG